MFKLVNQKEIKTVIEKSKFFSFSYNCYSTEQLNKILKEVRKKNQSATHVCYACIIHEDNDVLCYSSDDREPSGTAGLQILQALKENNMINTLCVVVRYFGGIKLGVAGLGRAYKESALATVKDNKKEVNLKNLYKINCDYNQFNIIKTFFSKNNIDFFEESFENNISFCVYLTDFEVNSIQGYTLAIEDKKVKKYC